MREIDISVCMYMSVVSKIGIVYIYIYVCVCVCVCVCETLVPFEVISSGCNAIVVPFQQLLEVPIEILLCERVNDLRHSLFHLLKYHIKTASELREQPKVIGSKVWTIGRVRNCLDAHLGQIVCDKDGVVDWCIVWSKCHWADLKSAGPFRRNLFLNSLKTST